MQMMKFAVNPNYGIERSNCRVSVTGVCSIYEDNFNR